MTDTTALEADAAEDVLDLEDGDEVVVIEEGDEPTDDDGDGETVIGFADEDDEEAEETPLIKKLRQQLRETQKQLTKRNAPAVADNDPEPVVPPRKSIEDFDFDQERFDAYDETRDKARDEHANWKVRQAERDARNKRIAEERGAAIEKQRKALGVSDYEVQAAKVHERLSDQQQAILAEAADDPVKLVYALGKSETKLDLIAGETNLAKFAAQIGRLEKDIKVAKRKAPAPESRVIGATGTLAVTGEDKTLAALEKEAERTGDRSKVIAYKRRQKEAKAA